jgi:hypothetical protein
MRLVLEHSFKNVAGDPYVKYPPLAAHDVNIVSFCHTSIFCSDRADVCTLCQIGACGFPDLFFRLALCDVVQTCSPNEGRRGTLGGLALTLQVGYTASKSMQPVPARLRQW